MGKTLLGRISKDLLEPKDRLEYLIRSAPYRYKVYEVPKKSKRGTRIIAQPAREVKKLQYWVINNIFPKFPCHKSATAYVLSKSIFNNIEPHHDNPYLLKLDFKDFFPSIKGKDFLYYAQNISKLEVPEEDMYRLIRILFWSPKHSKDLQLSIGAPSSPQLSNILLNDFDSMVADFCSRNGIVYTRYADDLTFSMKDKKLRGLTYEKVRDILGGLPSLKLHLNEKKTVYGSKAHKRMVTGLILANNGKISIGRDKKRLIRAKIHHFLIGKLSDIEQLQLRGLLAFIKSVEPQFIERMGKKYGREKITEIGKRIPSKRP